MKFRRYMHLERFGRTEVRNIELGTCYVFPKIDGTNASVWLNDEGNLSAGSRNRELSLDNDNAGFLEAMVEQENIIRYLHKHPTHRLYGEWLCLSGDTEIRMVSGGKRGHYMTLREMYEYSITPHVEKYKYKTKQGEKVCETKREPWWERHGYPQIFSLYIDEDVIKPQRMAKIVYTGDKEVYRVVTRMGKEIKSTLDHKFWTNVGWVQLKDLKIGDVVGMSSLTNTRTHRRYGKGTRSIYNLFDSLRKERVCESCGINNSLEVHHKDQDWKNNDLDNLEVLCRECHTKRHNNVSALNQTYDYMFDKIESIEYVGVEDCYDISMGTKENSSSFIANGFIVHNCPHALRTYREDAWRKFYVFDVCIDKEDGTNEYIPYDIYKTWLEEFDVDYIAPLKIIKNGSYESFVHELDNNIFLVKDGLGIGEGIVIKNYDFYNDWGCQVWAKIVASEFKDRHYKIMGCPEIENKMIEQEIVDMFVTTAFIEKEYAKIKNEKGDWKSSYIPMFLNRVFYELINEETWEILKKFKSPTINFKTLNSLTVAKIKKTKPEIFG